MAVCENHIEVVKILVNLPGIEINKCFDDASPLFLSCNKGFFESVKMLLEHPDIDINLTPRCESTPLYIACENDYIECVKLLLAHPNIDLHKANRFTGDCPLGTAAFRGIKR